MNCHSEVIERVEENENVNGTWWRRTLGVELVELKGEDFVVETRWLQMVDCV